MANPVDVARVLYQYRRALGRWPNLLHPRSYTEKMQVAKLTWRDPRMTELADKVRAKEVVAELLGRDWVTPTLYAGPGLPPRDARTWPLPYVIKANHRSKSNHFVRRPGDADWDLIEAKVEHWLGRSYGRRNVEWCYRDIPRQVLVEPCLGGVAPPPDYKLFVFGGRVRFISLNWNRDPGPLRRMSVDLDWNRLPFYAGEPGGDEDGRPPRPASLEAMVRAAELIGADYPAVRVDFYDIDGAPRFGEVTFYSQSGLFRFTPPEYDAIIGAMWPDGRPPDRR